MKISQTVMELRIPEDAADGKGPLKQVIDCKQELSSNKEGLQMNLRVMRYACLAVEMEL
jgi:hypothetical protein